MNVKELIKYLETLPGEMEVSCVQDEVFSNGDYVPNYFPAILESCFVVEEGELYIGNITL